MLNEEETLALIRLSKQGDAEAKELLVENNIRLIKSIVRRYLYKGTEFDDLFQLGAIGFLKAVNGFDESFGVRFSTYAVPMIAGEIKRFLRDDGYIKVSRSLKSRAREIRRFMDEYAMQHDAQPSIRCICEKFAIDESEAVMALECMRAPVSLYSKGEYKDEETAELVERIPCGEDAEDALDKMQLRHAVADLPERERKIIILRYFRGMTQTEVARIIGVSQVQISRIENRVIATLRKKLTEE